MFVRHTDTQRRRTFPLIVIIPLMIITMITNNLSVIRVPSMILQRQHHQQQQVVKSLLSSLPIAVVSSFTIQTTTKSYVTKRIISSSSSSSSSTSSSLYRRQSCLWCYNHNNNNYHSRQQQQQQQQQQQYRFPFRQQRKQSLSKLHSDINQIEIENNFVNNMKNKDNEIIDYTDDDTNDTDNDTIYALATGSNTGTSNVAATAIAIIRISGPLSLHIIQTLCQSKPNNQQNTQKQQTFTFIPRKVYLSKIYHPITNDILDEVILIYYQKPYSYTGENCIEIQCHGSRAVIHDILNTLAECFNTNNSSNNGIVRLAEPGEFTQRAYMNGKYDLLQIEALSDLIVSDTSIQRKQALLMYNGNISKIYNTWKHILIAALAHAEAIIDFGDDEALEDTNTNNNNNELQQTNIWGRITNNIQNLINEMEQQIQNENRGELVRDGIKISIIGPPNVGKSSLLNIISVKDAAIVSNIAGTTRDIIEVPINLNGMKCILQDTAGIRTTTSDIIEQIGIDRAIQTAQKADLVIAMIDKSDPITGWTILSNLFQNTTSTTTTSNDDSNNNDENDTSDTIVTSSTPINPNHVLVVYNKADLLHDDKSTNITTIIESLTVNNNDNNYYHIFNYLNNNGIEISCTQQHGIDLLLQTLTQRVMDRVNGVNGVNTNYYSNNYDTHQDSTTTKDPASQKQLESSSTSCTMITRARHRQHIKASMEALKRFVILSKDGQHMMIDMAAEELRLAASELGRITGAVDVEDVLDKLFADFCIGK